MDIDYFWREYQMTIKRNEDTIAQLELKYTNTIPQIEKLKGVAWNFKYFIPNWFSKFLEMVTSVQTMAAANLKSVGERIQTLQQINAGLQVRCPCFFKKLLIFEWNLETNFRTWK